MAVVDVELRSPGGATARASAQFTPVAPEHRWRLVVGSGLGGIGIGGLSILAPGVHLVLGWLAPILGVVIALAAASLTGWWHRVTGTCPACDAPLDAPGPGPSGATPATLPCPHCRAALQVLAPR